MKYGFDSKLLEQIENAARGRDRKIAAFDFDNTCILGDIGQSFEHYLIRKLSYKFDDARFWNLIHKDDGRDTLKDLVAKIDGDINHVSYPALVAELNSVYMRKLVREGKYAAYSWAVLLHVGISVAELERLSAVAVKEELQAERIHEKWKGLNGNDISIERGIRPFEEIFKIMEWLKEREFEIWVVSASNWWTVKVTAGGIFDVPPERIIAMRNKVDNNIMTDVIDPPVMYREGKREGIIRDIGVAPVVAFGDTVTDIEMLEFADIGVAFDRGNEEFKAAAIKNNWWMQPQSSLTPIEDQRAFIDAIDSKYL